MRNERLIESETEPSRQARKFPGVAGLPTEPLWARSLQAVRHVTRPVRGWLRHLPASASAHRLRSAIGYAGERARRLPIGASLSQLVRWLRAGSGDGTLWNRYALHLVIVCLAVGVVGIGQVRIPQIELLWPAATLGADLGGAIVAEQPSNRGLLREASEDVALLAAPVPHTTIPERARTEVITYTVQTNDNMWSIAQSFGLQVETLLWANPSVEQNPDLLSVDQVLNVPPVDGVYYTVKRGDTLAKLAKTYKTTVAKVTGLASNGLREPYTLVAGQKVMLVGGQKPAPPAAVIYPLTRVASAPKGAPKGSGRFAWPTRGRLSCPFGRGHTGIDSANRIGMPVLAADDGYVVLAGRDTYGYGIQIVIDHGNGFWTRYAHLSKLYVTAGDIVKKNQKIADMGDTGHSTGPHLHFEVIKDKTQRNPLSYLP